MSERIDGAGPAVPATATHPRRPAQMARAARGASQDSVRHHNLSLVLRAVRCSPGPVSRAGLAAATGLTRATVSALVDSLLERRMLTELDPVASRRAGRPAVPLVPAAGTVAALGMEINVDYLGVRALDLAGGVLAEEVHVGDFRGSDPGVVLDALAGIAGRTVAALAGPVVVAGTALALPGLVESRSGQLRVAPHLRWRDVDVVGRLAAQPVLAALPPRLANEADQAARAEAWARRHSGPPSFLYVSGEVGIGGAIVLDGAIFGGRHGWSGEIGHTVLGVEPGAPTLESFAGQDALLAAAGLERGAPVAELRRAADRGDPAALGALAAAGRALGVALSNVVNLVDVEHVVLGGIYAELAEHLAEPVRARLDERVISAPWARVEMSVPEAGPYPALTGSALEVLEDLVEDPSGWPPPGGTGCPA